ncbi:unnamed protein product [Lymnaea stagnalis]|uniref:C-type lectin domain-containing protein n=1 Tax=Lymnaea stagnalis TaxID=6523 RepID=A0AAV2HID1_LYMST
MAALDVCRSICGYLVEVDDNAEMAFLKTIIDTEKINGTLIAGTDKAKEGTWVYQRTGKTLTFTAWQSGEPNNVGGEEHCMNMLKERSLMYDVACQLAGWKLNFVCEVK